MLRAMRTTREGKDTERSAHLVGAGEIPGPLYASRDMRSCLARTAVSCIGLALCVAGLSGLGCAGQGQPPQTGANPPLPPDPNEVVRAREGVTGPVFQLRDGLAPESATAAEPAVTTGESADPEEEERASE